jgi:hypothetical protein
MSERGPRAAGGLMSMSLPRQAESKTAFLKRDRKTGGGAVGRGGGGLKTRA